MQKVSLLQSSQENVFFYESPFDIFRLDVNDSDLFREIRATPTFWMQVVIMKREQYYTMAVMALYFFRSPGPQMW